MGKISTVCNGENKFQMDDRIRYKKKKMVVNKKS